MAAPKGNKNALGNNGGPPIKYTFDIIYNDTLEFVKLLEDDDKVIGFDEKQQPIRKWDIMSIVELINRKPYCKDTYYSRYKDYTSEEFREKNPKLKEKIVKLADAYKKMHDILEARYVKGAMTNKLHPIFTMFNLKNNYGWKDKQEVDTKLEINDKASLLESARKRALAESAKQA